MADFGKIPRVLICKAVVLGRERVGCTKTRLGVDVIFAVFVALVREVTNCSNLGNRASRFGTYKRLPKIH